MLGQQWSLWVFSSNHINRSTWNWSVFIYFWSSSIKAKFLWAQNDKKRKISQIYKTKILYEINTQAKKTIHFSNSLQIQSALVWTAIMTREHTSFDKSDRSVTFLWAVFRDSPGRSLVTSTCCSCPACESHWRNSRPENTNTVRRFIARSLADGSLHSPNRCSYAPAARIRRRCTWPFPARRPSVRLWRPGPSRRSWEWTIGGDLRKHDTALAQTGFSSRKVYGLSCVGEYSHLLCSTCMITDERTLWFSYIWPAYKKWSYIITRYWIQYFCQLVFY